MNKRNGFSIIEGIIIVVIVAIIVSLGLVFYNNYIAKKDTATTQQESQTADADQTEPTQISSSSDLDTAATQLDQLDIEDTDDVSTLDSETEAF